MNKNLEERYNYTFLKALLFTCMAFFMFSHIRAQADYQSAVGLRLAIGGMASYKHALNEKNYLEGIIAVRWNGFVSTALFEWQNSLNSDNFYWFAGAGLHLGLHGRENVFNPEKDANDVVQINLGLDLIGGVEYVFENLPIVIAADYKPAFSFTGKRWFIPEEFGLSARYIFTR